MNAPASPAENPLKPYAGWSVVAVAFGFLSALICWYNAASAKVDAIALIEHMEGWGAFFEGFMRGLVGDFEWPARMERELLSVYRRYQAWRAGMWVSVIVMLGGALSAGYAYKDELLARGRRVVASLRAG